MRQAKEMSQERKDVRYEGTRSHIMVDNSLFSFGVQKPQQSCELIVLGGFGLFSGQNS